MALNKSLKEIISEDKTGLLGKHVSWERVCLRDVAEVLNGYPFESNLFQSANGMPLIRIRDVQTGSTNTYFSGEFDNQFLVNPGELLVGMDGDFNSARWKAKPSLLNQRVCKLTVDERFYSDRLLELLLPGFLAAIHAETSSVTVKHLSSKSIQEIELPLPPAAEQTRIVEKLEELLSDLDAGVAELKAAQKKLGQYRQSLLKAAVEGALTADWRKRQAALPVAEAIESGAALLARILTERRNRWETRQLAKFQTQGKAPPKDWQAKYPEPVGPDSKDLPVLPRGWVWASVDQCALDETGITDGPFGSNLKSSHYQETGPRVVRLKNIGEGIFVNANAHISPAHFELLKKHAVLEHDLLVAMLGEVLPRVCIAPADIAPAIVKADCARIRINQELISPFILTTAMNSQPTRDRVSGLVKGIGRPRINLGHVRLIAIAISPIEEQTQIDLVLKNGLENVVRQLDAISFSLKQATAQRKNILQAAFSGQLVPQDPADEPASELLARIRTERAGQPKLPKPRQTRRVV